MRVAIQFAIILFSSLPSFAQLKTKDKGLQMVKVPDTAKIILVNYLREKEKLDTPSRAIYIFNLANPKDYKFKNGIYTFKIMGPHFQRRIFVYSNNGMKIFDGYFIDDLLKEFTSYCESSGLSTKDKITYLKAITKFLQEEYETENN